MAGAGVPAAGALIGHRVVLQCDRRHGDSGTKEIPKWGDWRVVTELQSLFLTLGFDRSCAVGR